MGLDWGINGSIHPGLGQEAVNAGILAAIGISPGGIHRNCTRRQQPIIPRNIGLDPFPGQSERAEEYGRTMTRAGADAAVLADRKASGLVGVVAYTLSANKVRVLEGRGSLAGPGRVDISLNGGIEGIEAAAVLPATGYAQSVPRFILPDGRWVINSDQLLAVELGLTARQAASAVFPHPTPCDAATEALHDLQGMRIHRLK